MYREELEARKIMYFIESTSLPCQCLFEVHDVREHNCSTLTRGSILQVVDKLESGEPVVTGLILRRYDDSHLLNVCAMFFRDIWRSCNPVLE